MLISGYLALTIKSFPLISFQGTISIQGEQLCLEKFGRSAGVMVDFCAYLRSYRKAVVRPA